MILATLLCGVASRASAIVTSDDPQGHVVVAGQAKYGLNLDGVAQLGWNFADGGSIHDVIPRCTGALISDRHVLTAAHCIDQDRDGRVDVQVSGFPFFAAFETIDGPVAMLVDAAAIQIPSGWPEENADLAVLELVEIAPASIPRYPLYAGDEEIGEPIVISGYGDGGWGAMGADPELDAGLNVKRAGMNRYESVRDEAGTEFLAYDFDNGTAVQNALDQIGFFSDLGLGAEEAMHAPGDSGSPVFIAGKIAGVAAFNARFAPADVTDVTDSSWGDLQFDVRVASLQEFLRMATEELAVFIDPISELAGDLDRSGTVDLADFIVLKKNYGRHHVLRADGDSNYDGVVDLVDFGVLKDQFGKSVAVPEPSSLAIAVGSLAVSAARRHRRKQGTHGSIFNKNPSNSLRTFPPSATSPRARKRLASVRSM